MKVLMLGWEYPPSISGVLVTACEGLTRALTNEGIDIDFVVPALHGGECVEHMRIFGATMQRSQGAEHRNRTATYSYPSSSLASPQAGRL